MGFDLPAAQACIAMEAQARIAMDAPGGGMGFRRIVGCAAGMQTGGTPGRG